MKEAVNPAEKKTKNNTGHRGDRGGTGGQVRCPNLWIETGRMRQEDKSVVLIFVIEIGSLLPCSPVSFMSLL